MPVTPSVNCFVEPAALFVRAARESSALLGLLLFFFGLRVVVLGGDL